MAWVLCGFLAHCGPGSWRGGVLARFGWSEEGGVRVAEVSDEGPAAKAGLREDDRVLAIDGVDVRGLSREEVQQRLSGEVGSTVRLKVDRAGEILEFSIERAPYKPRD